GAMGMAGHAGFWSGRGLYAVERSHTTVGDSGFEYRNNSRKSHDHALLQRGVLDWMERGGTGVKFLAMITLGVVAAWALRRYFRRQAGTAAVMGMLGLAILAPVPAHAAETVHGNPSYTLPQGQEIKTDLFVAGDHVLIDGTVDGDLVVWAHEVEVNGQVRGDIIAFTQELRITVPS